MQVPKTTTIPGKRQVMDDILNSSVEIEYLMPTYVKDMIQIGRLHKLVSDKIPPSVEIETFPNGRMDTAFEKRISNKVDLVLISLNELANLTNCLETSVKVLRDNGQCIVFLNRESVEKIIEIDTVLTSVGLMRYRSGVISHDENDFRSMQLYAIVTVKLGYNPILHARKLANQQRNIEALDVLNAIPDEFLSDDRLNNLLQLEKKKYQGKPENTPEKTLFVGLVSGENYGWGVCSHYLIKELSKILPTKVLNTEDGSGQRSDLKGSLFQALTNIDFDPLFPNARANNNFGYTFFENELTDRSLENSKSFDLVLGGSTWCMERMREKGITNSDVLIQGIDPEIFYPVDSSKRIKEDRFVVFSGGKFELRKGQDLVLRAIKILQDKYPDVWLINGWYNLWPGSVRLMGYSKYIKFQYRENESWTETMLRTYHDNNLDPTRIQTLELIPQNEQRALFAQTDIGVFPNRCEGGTNLVLMEYMACGKPVIASNNSGHKDIVTTQNSLLINHMSNFHVTDNQGNLIARWQDPSLDELVAQLEYAYHHRDAIAKIGTKAGMDLKNFTWRHSAQKLAEYLPSAF